MVVQLEGVSRNHSPYPFLGLELCRQTFQALTSLSNNVIVKANQHAELGLQAWPNTTRYRPAIRQNEMREAIWMVIQDLHHQSPYAKEEQAPDKWNIPFHHKVCLYRLVEKLHEVHEVDDDKPSIFSADPKYRDFRRVIVSQTSRTLSFTVWLTLAGALGVNTWSGSVLPFLPNYAALGKKPSQSTTRFRLHRSAAMLRIALGRLASSPQSSCTWSSARK